MLLAVVWAAGTLNFFIPRLAPKNPIAEKLTQMAGMRGLRHQVLQFAHEPFVSFYGIGFDICLHGLIWAEFLRQKHMGERGVNGIVHPSQGL